VRHFAYYSQADGSYVREVQLPGVPPAWIAALPGALRDYAFSRWSHRRASPRPGEVALDVTQFDYPVGDFCWSVLRFGDGDDGKPLLDFPTEHTFLQLVRVTGSVRAWWRSPRPVRSTEELWVLDVTGTALEALYGTFGALEVSGPGLLSFVPQRGARAPARAELDVGVGTGGRLSGEGRTWRSSRAVTGP
jgi:hypothetical protein